MKRLFSIIHYAYLPNFQATTFVTKEVRLDLDLTQANAFCEIDAISVNGLEEPSEGTGNIYNIDYVCIIVYQMIQKIYSQPELCLSL